MLIVCIEPLKYNIQYNIWGKLYVFTDCKLIFKNFHFKISNKKYQIGLLSKIYAEAVVQRCSVKKLFLEISQNLKVNTCARVSFLVKLQASGLQLYWKRGSGKLCEVSKNTFFKEHLWTTASKSSNLNSRNGQDMTNTLLVQN